MNSLEIILWHNESSNETQMWLIDGHKIADRRTVIGENGQAAFVGLPWRIVGVGDFNRNGNADILWHNESSNETQLWVMDGHKIAGRRTVLGENGQPTFVGLPWRIVGVGDFDQNGNADILWHNESSNETQMWLMDGHKIASRRTVLGENGQAAFVGLPWRIVGVGDFDRNGNADVLWHNESSNETQIWLMDGHKVAGRRTVLGENGQAAFVGLPWRIVGVGDFDRNGNADILWHNESSNETQLWLMDGHKIIGRRTVLGENGQASFVGLPWHIVGAGAFNFLGFAEQKIREHYFNSGAHRGLLGFPLSDVKFDGHKAEQQFAGGKIEFLDFSPTPRGVATTCVRVRFVGFHCIQESDHDQLSSSDEPYFIIGVAGSNHSNTMRFGPYEDVDSGTDRFEAAMLSDPFSGNIIVPPIVIGVVAMENDEGSPEEAEEKVRDIFKAIEQKFEQAAATFGGAGPGNHVMPEWAREIVIGWVPEGIAAVFGLGDDNVGQVPLVMFDFNPGLENWKTPPGVGLHGQNPYNTVITVDGGSEGKYELRFQVEIVAINMAISA